MFCSIRRSTSSYSFQKRKSCKLSSTLLFYSVIIIFISVGSDLPLYCLWKPTFFLSCAYSRIQHFENKITRTDRLYIIDNYCINLGVVAPSFLLFLFILNQIYLDPILLWKFCKYVLLHFSDRDFSFNFKKIAKKIQ